VGGLGTGKTSLLRLLLDTADISPTATPDQLSAVDNFLRGSPERTQEIKTACVEICESRYDRVLLTVVDTPGLDFHQSRELNLEWQVSSILKYVDQQYADTLSEVSTNASSALVYALSHRSFRKQKLFDSPKGTNTFTCKRSLGTAVSLRPPDSLLVACIWSTHIR
jgi:hypothetical protein